MHTIPWLRATLAAAVLASGLAAGAGPMRADDKQPKQEQKAPAAKVKCPVCGMEVDAKTAAKSAYNGKTYYFCSRDDKAEFDKNPQKYAKK